MYLPKKQFDVRLNEFLKNFYSIVFRKISKSLSLII